MRLHLKKILGIIILFIFIISVVFFVIMLRKQDLNSPWGSWVEAQTEFSMKHTLADLERSNSTIVLSDEWKKSLREKRYAELEANAEGLKKVLSEPPPLKRMAYQFELDENMPQKYQGPWPQTAQSLMDAFDEYHNQGYTDETFDAKYPRAEWLTMLIERGVTFEHYGDYAEYLNMRVSLKWLEDKPEEWEAGFNGIAPAHDWDTFKDNYIDRNIWEMQQLRAAQQTDPTIWTATFGGSNKDIFLPHTPNRVYVKRSGHDTLFNGVSLTEQERDNFIFKGIEPEGVEMVYLDENDNILDEKLSPLSWEAIFEKAGPPPPGWEKDLPEGWEPPPGLVEAINKKWKNTDTATQALDDVHTIPSETVLQNELLEDSTQDHLKSTQAEKKFREMLTQAEEEFFESLMKTDAELEAAFEMELEKYFIQEGLIVPSEADFEKEFRKQFEAEVLTPISLDKAMETLERHGLTEGFRRLQNEDPEVAKVIAELLGARRLQRKAQRYTPPPKPPEPPKPEED